MCYKIDFCWGERCELNLNLFLFKHIKHFFILEKIWPLNAVKNPLTHLMCLIHLKMYFYSNRLSVETDICGFPSRVSVFCWHGWYWVLQAEVGLTEPEHNCELASVQCLDSLVSNSILGTKQPTRTAQIRSTEPESHLDLGTISPLSSLG